MRSRLAFWRRIGAPHHVLRWLREGVRCDWIDGPPPKFHHGVSRTSPQDREWATSECDRCLLTGAFERASCFDYVSKAFIVEHNGKRRLVFDLKFINSFQVKRACRFGSLASLRRTLHQGDLMWSIDLSDAYHHIGYHRDSVKYFTFAIETTRGVEYFHTAALNFGWCRSPQIFTEVMKPVVAYLRDPTLPASSPLGEHTPVQMPRAPNPPPKVMPWLDDFAFFLSGSLPQAKLARDFSFALLSLLGITRNATKGQPEPSTMLHDHLGYGIDSASMRFLLTAKRERKLRGMSSALLGEAARSSRLVPKRRLASLLGLAQSSDLALPLVRLWLRSPYDDVSSRAGWTGAVRLSHQSMRDLRHLTTLRSSRHVGKPIALRPDTAVASVDAGPYGWGGQLWYRRCPPVAGFWSPSEAARHITWRELRAVRLFIDAHIPLLERRRLLLHEDNQAVVAMVHSLTSRSPELMAELRLLVALLDEHDISLRSQYIRSKDNWVADFYSRIAAPREYTLLRSIFDAVESMWGPFSIDAFASDASAMLPRFWSERGDGAALAVDAFAQDWAAEQLVWAHPPPSMLPQLVQLLQLTPCRAVVCAPTWPSAQWHATLASLATASAHFPPGALQPLAHDAPRLLSTWGVSVFLLAPPPC